MKDKIINIFRSKEVKTGKTDEKIKSFAGFNYVRLDKDENGKLFNEQQLLKYARKCHYLVSVMKEKNGATVLYNYEVPSEKLMDFVLKFYNNELQGTIIEIHKYVPEDLA